MTDPPLMERLATGTNDAGPLPPPRPAHGPAETVATGGNAGPSNVPTPPRQAHPRPPVEVQTVTSIQEDDDVSVYLGGMRLNDPGPGQP